MGRHSGVRSRGGALILWGGVISFIEKNFLKGVNSFRQVIYSFPGVFFTDLQLFYLLTKCPSVVHELEVHVIGADVRESPEVRKRVLQGTSRIS